jgi:putative transposase
MGLEQRRRMAKSRYTEAQIRAVKQVEAGHKPGEVARELGVSRQTIYAWKAKYRGMDAGLALKADRLQDENTRLRKLLANLTFDAGYDVGNVARELGVSRQTIYAWKAKYREMDAGLALKAQRLRDENTRLQKLLTDLRLEEGLMR